MYGKLVRYPLLGFFALLLVLREPYVWTAAKVCFERTVMVYIFLSGPDGDLLYHTLAFPHEG
jgi:hypothetical protein